MALEIVPVDPSGSAYYAANNPLVRAPVPGFTTLAKEFGVFKNISRSSAGTTEITAPVTKGAIVLTDLLLTASKAATSDVTIHFDDGVRQEVIALSDSINAAINLAVGFQGRWHGWRDAHIDLVTTGNVIVNVTLGYYKIPLGLEFAEWDALR